MIKTKRILNVWNSLFTTDAICLFFSLSSLLITSLGRTVCVNPFFWPSLLRDDSQDPPVYFVFILGRREGGKGVSGKWEEGGEGGGALVLLAKVPRKRKEKK